MLLLILMGCNNEPSQLPQLNTDSVAVKQPVKNTAIEKIATADTMDLQYGSVLLIGDKRVENYLNSPLLKFEPYVGFNTFKTKNIYKGPKAKINYKSNKIAREYKTMITQSYIGADDGANFAGHYIVASWGCGMPCQQCALVDMLDGKVYEGPFAEQGFEFVRESRLLIVNPPPDSTGYIELYCNWCKPRMYVWDEEKKHFEELMPGGDLKQVDLFYGP
ncbi:MAG: hypothetical protein M0D57_06750 [Sphingobacteriales bacterium JAD_PAG50586_3]|nr:MAG: hypothetical protein M0D57_06750 [Sphingobacteriales bacterium JAD_PAG50586_3]